MPKEASCASPGWKFPGQMGLEPVQVLRSHPSTCLSCNASSQLAQKVWWAGGLLGLPGNNSHPGTLALLGRALPLYFPEWLHSL